MVSARRAEYPVDDNSGSEEQIARNYQRLIFHINRRMGRRVSPRTALIDFFIAA